MHDKAVRRRRAVLLGLVGLSLMLLTLYFLDGSRGPLQGTQRGVMEVLSPIQEGASRALKPVRDLFGWFDDTLDAKSELAEVRSERDKLRKELALLQGESNENDQLRRMVELDSGLGIDPSEAVTARVITRSPSLWYSTLEINKGSKDGVREGQPVINGEGLVGKVRAVSRGSAWVTLITDQDFGASAKAVRSGEPGTIKPAGGSSPGALVFGLVPEGGRRVRKGEKIVTAGTSTAELPSLFPASIPIGEVTAVREGDGELDRRILVKPAVDVRRVEVVQVVTSSDATGSG